MGSPSGRRVEAGFGVRAAGRGDRLRTIIVNGYRAGSGAAMTGVEVAVGFLFAWAVRKANRVGGRPYAPIWATEPAAARTAHRWRAGPATG